jgi:hypothetical protein
MQPKENLPCSAGSMMSCSLTSEVGQAPDWLLMPLEELFVATEPAAYAILIS